VNFTGNPDRPISGVLSFVNNTVDSATGTIQLIGDFENTQGNLFPGQFVNTTLTLKQETNATVVPSQAVQNGPKGQFVFVVKPDATVENVPVVASSTIEGLSVIQKGVQPGDKVVIDGQANLVTGGKIKIQDEKPDSTSKNGDTNTPVNAGENAGKDPSSDGKSGKSKHRSHKSGNGSAKPAGESP
jgi:membrane fusion protein, multidrug efflux system